MNMRRVKQIIVAWLSRIGFSKRIVDAVHRFRMRKARRALQIDGLRICADLCQEFAVSTEMRAFVTYGSLLGLVREGKFIEHDDDIDVAIVVDSGFSWREVDSVMESIVGVKARRFGYDGVVTEQAYKCGDLDVDIFAMYPVGKCYRSFFYTYHGEGGKPRFRAKYQDTPKHGILISKSFHGSEVLIPDNAEEFLACVYGEDWREPRPGYCGSDRYANLEGCEPFVEYFE